MQIWLLPPVRSLLRLHLTCSEAREHKERSDRGGGSARRPPTATMAVAGCRPSRLACSLHNNNMNNIEADDDDDNNKETGGSL